ncbi:glycosyltransferase family 2 protein [Candidatus Woesearchaeota archaeon]|nr:glycosyltransferase family 2 protein [Candidatus Woesearchaeota archaeon]
MEGKVFIIIPAFNEGKKIGEVVASIRQEGYANLVVVDDGSKDKTAAVAAARGAIVLRHMINRGQGAALKTGIEYALQHGADIIVTFDADGQHHPQDIQHMIAPVAQGKIAVTLGSRFLGHSEVPPIKRLILKGGILFTRIFSSIWLTDVHNGFRAFSRRAAEQIRIKQDKMEHASEIIEEIVQKNIPFQEVPVTVTYTEYSKQRGQSPWNSLKIAFNLVWRKLTR